MLPLIEQSAVSSAHNFTQSHKTSCLHVRDLHASWAADLQSSVQTQLARSHTDLIPQGETHPNWEHPRANDWRELQPHDSYCLGYLGQRGLNLTVKLARMQTALFKSETSHHQVETLKSNDPMKAAIKPRLSNFKVYGVHTCHTFQREIWTQMMCDQCTLVLVFQISSRTCMRHFLWISCADHLNPALKCTAPLPM